MEDFPLLLLFFIIYLIAGSSKKKKNKASGRMPTSPMRTRAQGEKQDTRAFIRNKQTREGFDAAFDMQADPCDRRRIHLHEVAQTKISAAAEGEDPCHFGGEQMQPEAAQDDSMNDMQDALGQDVLRGMIMSEILMRPQERRALQRSRREYHGY